MESTTTIRSRAAFGAACVVCCGVPMLVVLGVVSLGAALLGGVAVAVILGLALAVLGAALLVLADTRNEDA